MPSRYTIGQLARAVGVPTSTVRYYERIGLLQPSGRSGGNYRLYTDASRTRLRFIRAAQATGFSLADVETLLSLQAGETAPCQEVQQLIEARLAETAQRLHDLRHMQRVLTTSLQVCHEAEQSGRCQVMDDLTSAASSEG